MSSTSATAALEPEDDLGLDWSQPIKKDATDQEVDELKLEWSVDDEEVDEDADDKIKRDPNLKNREAVQDEEDDTRFTKMGCDIMAQQFKFIACLKIMMEEVSCT